MTDQLMFNTWVGLLRPLFPPGAEFIFRPKRRLICIDSGARTVVIAFTQLGWRTYRGARSSRRARADANLAALVQAELEQTAGEENACDFPGGELRIKVASIDLFPPPSGALQPAAQGVSAS